VLARSAWATRNVQFALAGWGIPHRVLGALGLYERAEVKDALAYLTLLANPADSAAFRRAVAAPRRGVGPATATRVIQVARQAHRDDIVAACQDEHALRATRSSAARERLDRFGSELERVRGDLSAGRSVGHVVLEALSITGGLVRSFESRRDRARSLTAKGDAERVLEDLRSLCRAARTYEADNPERASLTGFLEAAAGLHAQQLEGPDERVTVSTIHRAKGAEAALVFVLACEEGQLPAWRSLQSADEEALAEERRLFYVAATRAKDRLALTWCRGRGGRPTEGPSRFLGEARLRGADADS
jgi:DNA helicase II / ATP-dependent DNA helicase PcrA